MGSECLLIFRYRTYALYSDILLYEKLDLEYFPLLLPFIRFLRSFSDLDIRLFDLWLQLEPHLQTFARDCILQLAVLDRSVIHHLHLFLPHNVLLPSAEFAVSELERFDSVRPTQIRGCHDGSRPEKN